MDEQNIPIDINSTKLLEWLISRRHVNKDWQNNILKVREKINNAIQDMPEHHGIVELLKGQHINYFHCLKIIEILKETEADTKNLFGRYGSQRMKDWQEIVQLYQRDNLYLGEAAQILIRNVNFEVPSLRKQTTKLEQIEEDCHKKIRDYKKIGTVAMNDFTADCEQLGINGVNIKSELLQLLGELPNIYERISVNTKEVEDAVNLYSAFVRFHTGDDNALPLLKYIIANGNTSVYEYMYNKKPLSIIPSVLDLKEDKISGTENVINFGDDEVYDTFDTKDFTVQNEAIDWGGDDGFEIVEHSDFGCNAKAAEIADNPKCDEGIAQGDEALGILDNPSTRELLLNDLAELEAFLTMRVFELSTESDLLSISQLQDAPVELQMQTVEVVATMLGNVKSVTNDLLNKRTLHLHNIKHSPKYIDILTASVSQKLAMFERATASSEILNAKIKESVVQRQDIQPTIDLIIEKTKVLRKEIEDDISLKYKGRPVHIIGAINML